MKITDINFVSFDPKDLGICAEAVITLDGSLCIHKLRVISGSKGLFLAFPNIGFNIEDGTKRYRDIVHPKTKELRDYLEQEIINAYKEKLKQSACL